MKREILFKAKRVDNNEWVYGVYANAEDCVYKTITHYIIVKGVISYGVQWERHNVHPETVCQFTGEFDMEDNKIFEGDQMQHIKPFSRVLTVNWSDENCGFVLNNGDTSYNVNSNGLTVISNIHDL